MNQILNCIIVEDEPIHSKHLQKLLSDKNDINVLAVCNNIDDAFHEINKQVPDFIFLDIQLHEDPQGGFTLLKMFPQISFEVIFSTAHVDHNIQDIRLCGLDHLLKPYVQDELEEVLSKVYKKQGSTKSAQMDSLMQNLTVNQLDDQLIWFKLSEGYIPVKIKNLVYAESYDQYTKIFVLDEGDNKSIKEFMTSIGIGIWEKDLSPLKFCRIHNKYLINQRHILKFDKGEQALWLNHLPYSLAVSKAGKEKLVSQIKTSIFITTR